MALDAVTASLVLVGVAFGGYFVGGMVNRLTEGNSVARMFGGPLEEQLIQLAFAGVFVLIALRFV